MRTFTRLRKALAPRAAGVEEVEVLLGHEHSSAPAPSGASAGRRSLLDPAGEGEDRHGLRAHDLLDGRAAGHARQLEVHGHEVGVGSIRASRAMATSAVAQTSTTSISGSRCSSRASAAA